MKKILMILLAVMLLLNATAQQVTADKPFGLMSPETENFIKYGNLPLPNATGELTFQIPLYTYKDKDFELPIILNYAGSGFTPSKPSGLIGVNWTLGAGGFVTREINGSPDDSKGVNNGDIEKYINKGFWVGLNETMYSQSDISTFNVPSKDKGSTPYGWDTPYDMEPDIFKFNFNGHSGSFVIGNDKSIKVMTGGGYKVDLSGMVNQDVTAEIVNIKASVIKITTSDGFQYVFGGIPSNLEICKQQKPDFCYILAWHLNEVIAPNGRVMKYIYGNNTITRKYQSQTYTTISSQSLDGSPDPLPTAYFKRRDFVELTQVAFISKIVVDDFSAVFFEWIF